MVRFLKEPLKGALFLGFLLLGLTQVYCRQSSSVAQDSCGFKQNAQGQRVSLKSNLPLKIYFDSQFPIELRSGFTKAVETWNNAAKKYLLKVAGEISGTTPRRDGVSIVYWDPNWDQSTEASKKEQADTIYYFSDNEIIEADFIVNGKNFDYSTSDITPPRHVDMESLALHELGHALGLTHTTVQPSVMAPSLLDEQMRRSLYQGDYANLSCEY